MDSYRILWMMNTPLPAVSDKMGLKKNNKEGWLSGLFLAMSEFCPQVLSNVAICFPIGSVPEDKEDIGAIRFEEDGVVYYGILEDMAHPECYDARLEKSIAYVLRDFAPDLIHIFGTEYAHATEMAKQARELKHNNKKIKVAVSMQGVMKRCFEEYMCFLPEKVCKKKTFRDFVKRDGLLEQQEKFGKRAVFERETLQNADYVFGRTRFDKEEVLKTNQDLTYCHVDEMLRKEFYSGEWSAKKCRKYSVFASQGNYPLKGIHQLIKALAIVREEYPEVVLRVAGDNITAYGTFKEKLKIGGYGKYVRSLIKKYGLENNVEFIGSINAARMKEEFLKANVFVCPSSVENSPNSVGEAMLLKVPVVASYVGGIMDIMTPEEEGLYYDASSETQLAERIMEVFAGGDDMERRLEKARQHAMFTHDRKRNALRICNLYKEIMEN